MSKELSSMKMGQIVGGAILDISVEMLLKHSGEHVK